MEKKEYRPSQKVLEAEAAVGVKEKDKPGEYASRWEEQLRQVMDRILNRENFRYNLNGDALYRQYRDQAMRDGKLAMADTMGQAAALTGGYGNSYAQNAGQQAYWHQMEGLADKIPELYALAMDQYRQQSADLQQKYDLLAGLEGRDYNRYRDSLSAWQKEADQLWQQYTDARDYDYDAYRDGVADWQWQQNFDESKRRYDQQWNADHPAVQPVTYVYTAPQKAAKAEEKKEEKPKIPVPAVGVLSKVKKI